MCFLNRLAGDHLRRADLQPLPGDAGAQAALRPTQTRACNVTWLGYYETMIEQALDIIGSKATAATLLNGDDLSSGLMQMDPGMSL